MEILVKTPAPSIFSAYAALESQAAQIAAQIGSPLQVTITCYPSSNLYGGMHIALTVWYGQLLVAMSAHEKTEAGALASLAAELEVPNPFADPACPVASEYANKYALRHAGYLTARAYVETPAVAAAA